MFCEVLFFCVDGVDYGGEVFDVVVGLELWVVDGVFELGVVGDLIC